MPMDTQVILRIPLCTRNIPDFLSWHYEMNGLFSVRLAYHMLVATRSRREAWLENNSGTSSASMEERSWKNLWKTRVPGKVRMFLWRLSKHSIPTNNVRARRNMAQSNSCGLCGAPDSWRHSLLDCTMARCTWALVEGDLLQKMAATTEPKAKHWLFTLTELLSHAEFVKLSVTSWAIWTARRKAIHEGIFQSPHAIMSFVERYIIELETINVRQEPDRTEPRVVPSVGRKPKAPPVGFAKINVDAGCRTGSRGTTVAVCRDNMGTYLKARPW